MEIRNRVVAFFQALWEWTYSLGYYLFSGITYILLGIILILFLLIVWQ
jgi:hypothetical protein